MSALKLQLDNDPVVFLVPVNDHTKATLMYL